MKRSILLLLLLLPSLALGGSGYTPPAGGGGVSGNGTGVTDAAAFRTALGLGTSATTDEPVDVWDYEWTAGAGTMASDGWTNSGSPTDAADTIGGVTCRTLTPPAGATSAYVYRDMATPPNGAFEWRALVYLPTSTASVNYAISFNSGTGGMDSRAVMSVDATGLQFYNSSNVFAVAAVMGGMVGRWVWLTWRFYNGDSGDGRYEIWLGASLAASGATNTTTFRPLTTAGRVEIGKLSAASGVAVTAVARFMFRNGVNEARPDYTFRALAGAPGP